jgi:predicted transcriptional regulator
MDEQYKSSDQHTDKTLKDCLKERGISLYRFSKESGIKLPTIYFIANDRHANPTIDTVRKIYETSNKFGSPIDVWDYLSRDKKVNK